MFYAPIGSASRIVEYYQCLLKTNNSYQLYSPNSEDIAPFFFISTDKFGIDTVQKQLASFGDGGNFGTHSKTIHQWKNGNLIEIKKLEMHIEMNYYQKSPHYLFQEFRKKNQDWVLTKEWVSKKTEDKIWKYFENWNSATTQIIE